MSSAADRSAYSWTWFAEVCDVCAKRVEVMCFRGTGVCSNNCRKARAKRKTA